MRYARRYLAHPLPLALLVCVACVLVTNPGAAASHVAANTQPDIWLFPITIVRFVHYIALLSVSGGSMFILLVRPPKAALATLYRGLLMLAALGIVTTLLNVSFKSAQLMDDSVSGLWRLAGWRLVMTTTFGTAAAIGAGGLLLVTAGVLLTHSLGRVISSLGSVATAASFAFTGHSATMEPQWLAALTGAHTLLVAFWAGSLWPLLVVLRCAPEQAAATVRRFSRIAMLVVMVLVAVGIVLAILAVGAPSAVLANRYGITLTLKLIPVVLLLLRAAYNKWQLTPLLERSREEGVRELSHSIRQEIGAVLIVLAATAVLSQTPTPDQ